MRMTDSSTPRRGGLADSTRVEAFSDGVLAIAITLLILDVKVPEYEDGQLLNALTGIWPNNLPTLPISPRSSSWESSGSTTSHSSRTSRM